MQIRPEPVGGRALYGNLSRGHREDRWALEKQQQMFAYPDDGYVEAFLRPDRALRRAREFLTDLERAEQMPRSLAAE